MKREQGKLTDMVRELETRGLLPQVESFARIAIDLHRERLSCQLRANVGSGRIGRFHKLVTVDLPG